VTAQIAVKVKVDNNILARTIVSNLGKNENVALKLL